MISSFVFFPSFLWPVYFLTLSRLIGPAGIVIRPKSSSVIECCPQVSGPHSPNFNPQTGLRSCEEQQKRSYFASKVFQSSVCSKYKNTHAVITELKSSFALQEVLRFCPVCEARSDTGRMTSMFHVQPHLSLSPLCWHYRLQHAGCGEGSL